MENQNPVEGENTKVESKAMETPARDKMMRPDSVQRKRASTADILGGNRLSNNTSPDYRHD